MTLAGTKKPKPPHPSQSPEPGDGLPKSYTPAAVEGEIRAQWDQAHAFHANPTAGGKPFCILIPPPNVTAALHLGHAFNNTLQDVLTRYHRMRGFNTLWMPGTDHAGIATQAVVEKRLMLQGKRRTDFTREQFIAKVQEWKDEYEATIIEQLKAMGASCDFARTRFTMDEVCAKAVREAFFRLFKDGLIYRGKRLVNWDPATQTALADDEVEMEEVQGQMWYLRYPLVDDRDSITVATTRPETMLGDTAVAMNPKDPRAAKYVGKKVRLPVVDRVVPIIADDYVVMPSKYGGDPNDPKAQIATGFLKVTPAHDPNDWEIRQRHPEIDLVNVLAPDATVSDKYGWADVSSEARQFIGMTREQAQKSIAKWFKDHGLLEDAKPYTHSVGHSYRSHVPIEPYLSDQWYVRVTDDRMRGEALRAMSRDQFEESQRAGSSSSPSGAARSRSTVGAEDGPARAGDGALRFYPSRYAKTFQIWHENLRDWCISRQLWWGHRIPVWSCEGDLAIPGGPTTVSPPIGTDLTFGNGTDERFPGCACQSIVTGDMRVTMFVCVPPTDNEDQIIGELEREGFQQDPDVLDTWFSSGLWPISTMGWPDPEAFPREFPEGSKLLNTFNPSTVLLTAREIITLWVSRMVMFNRYFRDGKLPFKDVYIHAMIQDGYGQKMSKSLGNGVDPRDIIHSHGADALRFVMAKLATSTQDVRLPVDMVCPHPGCGEPFQPKEITTPSGGYRVADAQQTCPKCRRTMVSGYGFATGLANPTKEMPLARNTSRRFDEGRNFANKIWNATRFALSNLSGESASVGVANLPLVDRWIISRLHRTLRSVESALKEYQFSAYADAMYDFFWRDFCDWYIEAIKPPSRDVPIPAAQQQVLRTVLNASMRLLHPIMPFVTEALWTAVSACGTAGLEGVKLAGSDLLATAAWPDINPSLDDQGAIAQFERVQTLTNAIRTIRAERQVPPKKKIRLTAPADVIHLIESAGGVVQTLAGLEAVEPQRGGRIPGAISLAFEGHELMLSGLIDEVDVATEKARLTKLITEKQRAAEGYRNKLNNEGYVSKAPPEKVDETRRLLQQAQADLAAAQKGLESLGQ